MKIKRQEPTFELSMTEIEAMVLFHALNAYSAEEGSERFKSTVWRIFNCLDNQLPEGAWKEDPTLVMAVD